MTQPVLPLESKKLMFTYIVT